MLRIELMTWEKAQSIAGPLRFAIFVGEQNVPPGIELDEKDVDCIHAIAYDEAGKAIGTGRLLPDGHIGRMAVVKEWRRRGVGAAILEALIEEARKRGHKEVALSAQLQALSSTAVTASPRKARSTRRPASFTRKCAGRSSFRPGTRTAACRLRRLRR